MTKEINKIMKSKNRKNEEMNRRKKRDEISSDSDCDSDSTYNTSDEDEEFDEQEYRKMLKKLYPSKHIDKKVKSCKNMKKAIKKDIEELDSSDEEVKEKETPVKKSEKKIKGKDKRKRVTDSSDEDLSSNYETADEDDESCTLGSQDTYETDSDIEASETHLKKNNGKGSKQDSKFNIIFTIGSHEDDDEDWESCSDDEFESDETENEDDPVSSDSDSDSNTNSDTKKEVGTNKKQKINVLTCKNKPCKKTQPNQSICEDTIKKTKSESELLEILKDLKTKNNSKHSNLIDECIVMCESKLKDQKKKQEKKVKKQKDRNERIFKRILRDKNTNNDFDFYNKMEVEQQNKVIKELREINKLIRVEKPYRLTLLEANIPIVFKATAIKKINSLRHMEPGSGEYYKIKNWVDTFMRIPFGNYSSLPISLDNNSVENCHDFIENAQKTLDQAVHGLNDAKMQIMQMLGQLITNPKAIGSAIAIHGPAGTGKTSLVKDGISKILNRPFTFIALGGATDSSHLEGHGYTYEGSTWGKIVQILIESKCMNPIIYFDELDKISETPKGEEIAGILTHLTDTTQNSQFHDKYFADIDFDLSKCLFIFSYNDESKVNPILKDRMYRIQTTGYNQKQKTIISNDYLLPKIREEVKFKQEDVIIPDQTLHYIIDSFCNKEDGVRNMKRCLEIIHTKLNLYRLMKPGSNLFEKDMSIKVEFPFTVTKDIVDKLIKKKDQINPSLYHLYV
uniref:ATPase AAA-type core domain-containing protein n=1 Tax=viral metagenome TaxID=1070528 RepID=A0A6C0IW43_9ZZZZ